MLSRSCAAICSMTGHKAADCRQAFKGKGEAPDDFKNNDKVHDDFKGKGKVSTSQLPGRGGVRTKAGEHGVLGRSESLPRLERWEAKLPYWSLTLKYSSSSLTALSRS